jgi:hypothetical protein
MASFGLGTFGGGGLGDMLQGQVEGETDELRKKRLQEMQSLMGSMGGGGDSSLLGQFGQQLGSYNLSGRVFGNLRRSLSGGFMR